MGLSLEQVLSEIGNGGKVQVTMASNQDNGLVSYSFGELTFHPATGGPVLGSFRKAHFDSGAPFKMFFSDRLRQVDSLPPQGTPDNPVLGGVPQPRQPFDVDRFEEMGVSLTLGAGVHLMSISLFNSRSIVTLTEKGDLLVGLGPSLGNSAAGFFVVSFNAISVPAPH